MARPMLQCQVQVTGPDGTGSKSTFNAFHVSRHGRTTLSCSGLVVHTNSVGPTAEAGAASAVVLAPITCLYPFLTAAQKHKPSTVVTAQDLSASVGIDVLLSTQDALQLLCQQHGSSSSSGGSSDSQSHVRQLLRLPVRLLTVLQLPAVLAAAQQLLLSTNTAAAAGAWRLSWLLADQQPLAAATPAVLGHLVLLQLDLNQASQAAGAASKFSTRPVSSCVDASAPAAAAAQARAATTGSSSSSCLGVCQGQAVMVTGSPFGCLAEQQFFGSVVTGCISLLLPPLHTAVTTAAAAAGGAATASPPAAAPPLFVLDGRCMPGMEGGPICCRACGALLGVLGVPLSNSSSQAELQLGIPVAQLAATLMDTSHAYLAAALLAAACCSCGGRGDGAGRGSTCSSQACNSGSSRGSSSGSVVGLQRQPAAAEELPGQQYQCQQQQQPPPQQEALVLVSTPAAAVAAGDAHSTGASYSSSTSSTGGSSSSRHSSVSWPQNSLQSAVSGVVMIRTGTSWASGVLITQSGLVLTAAHLFRPSSSTRNSHPAAGHAAAATSAAAGGRGGSSVGTGGLTAVAAAATAAAHISNTDSLNSKWSSSSSAWSQPARASSTRRLYPLPPQHLQAHEPPSAQIRLTITATNTQHGSSGSCSSSRDVWLPAKVVYSFAGYLDLAVLQICPSSLRSLGAGTLQPLQLVMPQCDVTPGDGVYVIGHGLFGPRMELSPAVTAGCAARLVSVPLGPSSSGSSGGGGGGCQQPNKQQQQQHEEGWRPSMVISTAAVHSGASGGALVDAAGRLVGLVTSNARHVRGRTLPHLNFCISASELRPVWGWAQQQGQQQWSSQHALLQDVAAELRGLDVHSKAGSLLWGLQPFMHAAAAPAPRSRL